MQRLFAIVSQRHAVARIAKLDLKEPGARYRVIHDQDLGLFLRGKQIRTRSVFHNPHKLRRPVRYRSISMSSRAKKVDG